MNRRDLVKIMGAVTAGWPLTGNTQQASAPAGGTAEAVLDPELPIIDPHHHLWNRPGSRYLLDDLLADTSSGHNIIATVYVQARSMYRDRGPVEMQPVGEVEFANGVGAMCASGFCGKARVCAGIVGHADLTLGSKVEPVLTALLRAGGDRLRGIRHITAWDADTSLNNPAYPAPPRLLADKTFREGFALLGRLGLSFDTWLYHPQIDELADLAAAFPDTNIVLDHMGGPIGIGGYKREAVFPGWKASIKALAARPNVYVKIGGLGQVINGFGLGTKPEPATAETLASAIRPYVETCIDAFGVSRSMFESNFPVDKVSYSYGTFWNACKLLVKGASGAEKTALFSGTASRFYRLAGIGSETR